ncbi:MAG: hypothetical protein KDD29_10435 [Flavobacteriales bacterium]|nr:hypothetical protein [Flavobacteriales bacterium]
MKKSVLLFVLVVAFHVSNAQLKCIDLLKLGVNYTLTAHKNGRGKLLHTEDSINSKIKHRVFYLQHFSDLPEEYKTKAIQYKFPFKDNDTVLVYDWDIMNHAKMNYHGEAVGKIHFDCSDSTIHIQKYILDKGTKAYVPTRFKIRKFHKDDFIFYDMDHPYLNIVHYFKKVKPKK